MPRENRIFEREIVNSSSLGWASGKTTVNAPERWRTSAWVPHYALTRFSRLTSLTLHCTNPGTGTRRESLRQRVYSVLPSTTSAAASTPCKFWPYGRQKRGILGYCAEFPRRVSLATFYRPTVIIGRSPDLASHRPVSNEGKNIGAIDTRRRLRLAEFPPPDIGENVNGGRKRQRGALTHPGTHSFRASRALGGRGRLFNLPLSGPLFAHSRVFTKCLSSHSARRTSM